MNEQGESVKSLKPRPMKDPSLWVSDRKFGKSYSVKKHKRQRVKRGFSDYDWWGFDSYLTFVILGGLKKFKKDANGYPADLTQEEWNDILDKMIAGFEASEAIKNLPFVSSTEQFEEAQSALIVVRDEGMALFVKHYGQLWD